MVFTNKMSGVCWKCTENATGKKYGDEGVKPVTRGYDLVRALFKPDRGEARILDAWECRECHKLVPVDAWSVYVNTGNVVISHRPGI